MAVSGLTALLKVASGLPAIGAEVAVSVVYALSIGFLFIVATNSVLTFGVAAMLSQRAADAASAACVQRGDSASDVAGFRCGCLRTWL